MSDGPPIAHYRLTLFDTAIGRCAIAWNADHGVVGVQLPEASDEATRARVASRFRSRERCVGPDATASPLPGLRSTPLPEPIPDSIEHAVAAIQRLLEGEPNDLREILLDMSGLPAFHRRVYEFARTILPGTTATYGDVATHLGDPLAARAVGEALGANPFAIVVPCHRVHAAGRRLGGFSAHGGAATKVRILTIEGAHRVAPPSLFD